MSFRVRMENAARKQKSNIIVALDFPYEKPENRDNLLSKAQHVLDLINPYVCAVKFNHHLILPLGTFEGVEKLVKKVHDLGLIAIMDCKVNDIGSTNQVIAQYYYAAGFDALIANPFIGWDEGLQPIFEIARRLNRGVILLVFMSHKGADEGYGQTTIDDKGERVLQYISFAKQALKYEADGAVVGATYPEKLKEVHDILGDKVPIYSPGIGAQGGEAKAALDCGARFLIVGRAITGADDPAGSARKIRDSAKKT